MRVLSPVRDKFIRTVRGAVQESLATLVRSGADAGDEQTLRASLQQLDDFFLLVVVGEFNAGKSALINALLGEHVLAEGVTPTTTDVQILRHADHADAAADPGVRTITATAPFLRDIRLVDTPGTNAITREHEMLTERFVPRADLILFVTSADRPFTESERQFMARIREWGKKVLVVINKADILTAPELESVKTFVGENVRALLGFTPELFAVSARGAFKAKSEHDHAALAASGFPALEDYIRTTLNDDERFRLKVLNPIGVTRRLIEKYHALVGDRLELLREDVATVEGIRLQLDGYRREMTRTFQLRLADVDNVLHQFEKRGDDFFEETVRIGRIFDLLNRSKVRADFERQVIADMPRQVEERVAAVIDWLVASDLQQWTDVRDRLSRRRTEEADRMVGRLAGGFEYDRARLLDTVGRAAQNALVAQDHQAEAVRLAASVQSAVTSAALLEAGAVGLGTAVSLLATSTAADVTGILAAGVLASVGFVVLPRRRAVAKRELHARVASLREELMRALTAQFEGEVDRSARRIEDAMAPYVQFVTGEREHLTTRRADLDALRARLGALEAEVSPR